MKKSRSGAFSATLIAAAALLLSACGSDSGNGADAGIADMDPVTITMTTHTPENSPAGAALTAMKKEIEEKTDGKITLEPYFAGALVGGDEALSAISSGTADAGQLIAANWPQELPVSNWVLEMGALADPSLPFGLLQEAAAVHEMFLSEEALIDEYEGHNLKVLFTSSTEPYALTCTSPISSLSEAKGKRVRVAGKIWSDEAEALGMVPVNLSSPEVYDAMQRGVIDCASFSASTSAIFGLYDIAKELTPVTMSTQPGSVYAINLDTWNKLPKEAQAIVRDAANSAHSDGLSNLLGNYEDIPNIKGLNVHNPGSLDKILDKHHEQVLAQLPEDSPGAVTDPEAFIDRHRARLDEWRSALADLDITPTERDSAAILESYVDAGSFDIGSFRDALLKRTSAD